MTDLLTDLTLQTVGDTAKLIDSYLQTHAAFITCIYHSIGLDFGSHVVQQTVQMIGTEHDAKKRGNLTTFIGYLYTFGVVACTLVYDYVRLAIGRLEEEDVEVLLRLLRSTFCLCISYSSLWIPNEI